ncbi:hypothetical protein HBI56_117080 [Parastagonospora nodorum]|uniref:Uncharacterized protein n=1 Tax=Phaeosphaeria nodorum (strain SN15 / ATCC MYA-4574 / FGSC 10173) TaxID=321614 RepID=A0A7U2FD42_PHANO|nr:hypothetical protein HBH56_200000 [Parastagonospora nodorum]QRD00746.1 hypothetical protein JI435_415740 [Parastagonospora nodorum SN15]KAH3925839.1 hypothetical protein HBH54_176300 [Parastagonospora nodorum]KAH3952915.1 hypothetical protein HBH53_037680 [Parastagonospora nodorum]KAH3976371.1 hypothetical protein HBH52_120970 [Parastagonospora nodorum]
MRGRSSGTTKRWYFPHRDYDTQISFNGHSVCQRQHRHVIAVELVIRACSA